MMKSEFDPVIIFRASTSRQFLSSSPVRDSLWACSEDNSCWIWGVDCRNTSSSFGWCGANCLGWSVFFDVFSNRSNCQGHNELIKRRAKAPRSTPLRKFKRFTTFCFFCSKLQNIFVLQRFNCVGNILEDLDWQFWDQFPIGHCPIL